MSWLALFSQVDEKHLKNQHLSKRGPTQKEWPPFPAQEPSHARGQFNFRESEQGPTREIDMPDALPSPGPPCYLGLRQ